MISRTFKLCLNAGSGSAPYINVNQYDEGETWLFELYSENGERYIPSSGAIVGVKSDGHGIVNTGTVDSEGRVVITETQQMTASAGRAIYELSIDGLTHGTANFIVAVERKPTDDAVMSDSDLSLIQEAIDSAEVIVEVIGDGDPSEVIGEHVDAWLDNHPEATTTVEDGAITAPKINQSLWDKLLVSESASGNPASFDDGADDVPVSSLKVALEPVQLGSGDPSPSNVRPIIASNGKNLLQNTGTGKTENGITWTLNADGSVKCVGTSTANSLFVVNTFNFVSGTSYVLTGCPSGGAPTTKWQIQILSDLSGSASKTETGTGQTIDDLSGTYYVRLVVRSGNTVDFTWYPMIRLASVTDASYQPYQGIMVERTGKNLANFVNGYGIDTSGQVVAYGTRIATVNPITIKSGVSYKVIYSGNATGAIYAVFNGSTLVRRNFGLASGAVLDTSGGTDLYVCVYAGESTTVTVDSSHAMVVYGNETDATYEPYQSASYPYTLGQSVYGGTVDLATGVLTVTHGIVDLGSLTWEAISGGFYATIPYSIANDKKSYCSAYKFVPSANWATASHMSAELSDGQYAWYSSIKRAFFKNTAYATADEFKTAVTGQQLVYTLETPTTVQLTPTQVNTLLGYNNISSTGTVDVIYHADTKLYVDKMTEVDNAIIAPTEETFTATRNYTVNDLLIVADTLYKVTANIATGSAITPNSNVQQTTLSALIKALS